MVLMWDLTNRHWLIFDMVLMWDLTNERNNSMGCNSNITSSLCIVIVLYNIILAILAIIHEDREWRRYLLQLWWQSVEECVIMSGLTMQILTPTMWWHILHIYIKNLACSLSFILIHIYIKFVINVSTIKNLYKRDRLRIQYRHLLSSNIIVYID